MAGSFTWIIQPEQWESCFSDHKRFGSNNYLGTGSGLATFSAINAFNTLSISGGNNGDLILHQPQG